MPEPRPDATGRAVPPTAADPTLKVARPPVPGRAVRAEVAAGNLPRPPFRPDEPTVTLDGSSGRDPRRTLEFGTPVPVKVTVGPRPRQRRRSRTTPWIVAVVLALMVMGIVLLVMLLRGETIDADTDLIGAGGAPSRSASLSAGA
ncbi:MAG: hypothetical protein ACLGI3_05410 [Actinomycetes bacterium]